MNIIRSLVSYDTVSTAITNYMELRPAEKSPIVQLLKKFLIFYGTRRSITVITRALHWSFS
jgi:hypothetical protein